MIARSVPLLFAMFAALLPQQAGAECKPGVYGEDPKTLVVIGPALPEPAKGQRYLFRDGRRGATADPDSPVVCANDVATLTGEGGRKNARPRMETHEADVTFTSDATKLVGRLIEPAGAPDPARPLVVMVHGSEKTSAPSLTYGYMLVAQGISVFVYDKRGTGASGGDYTQNFELLADDAAAALNEAQRLARGRFGRSGYYGGSQGGWVAPLAATRSRADFVAIGFGLVVSPINEDLEQMLQEADEQHLGVNERRQIRELSAATSALLKSHFERGYERLEALRKRIGRERWARKIEGEYSGDMLRMSDVDLRRIGHARFDNLGLIWDYNAKAALASLRVPLLWVLAAEDREAPIGVTEQILRDMRGGGQPIDVYLFPHTDHGIFEYRTNPDGSRTVTRIAGGYLQLLADWIKEDVNPPYGNAKKL